MQTVTLLFMVLFVAVGLLIVGLSVPLIRRRVKPNRWYGFRTPKTMSSEPIWYEANAHAGQMGMWTGIVLLMFAWKMNPPINTDGLISGLPLVGLGSLAVQTSIIAAAIVLYFILRANFVAYNVAWSVVLLSTIVIHLWLSFRHLRSL